MAPRRTAFILGSILIHAGLGVGVFVSQVWSIERLDGAARPNSGFAVLMPPLPAPSGGTPKLPEVTIEKKQKKIVTEVVQPTVRDDTPATPAVVPTQSGSGDGLGSGSGPGSAGDTGHCLVDCGPGDGSGSAAPRAKPEPPAEVKDTFVPPNVLTMMRLTGTTQIHPTEVTKQAMQRDGRPRTTGIAKVCVSEIGAVTHASMLQSTKYPDYDALLLAGIRSWTYKPYAAKGRNVKVCGTVTFVYGMK